MMSRTIRPNLVPDTKNAVEPVPAAKWQIL